MNKRRGAYITFDGGEGTGKSTQVRLFKDNYPEDVVTVREPGETPIGLQLRTLLLDSKVQLTDIAELLLFSADRNLTYRLTTLPAISNNKAVISDRSYLSTLAYQHYGRGLPRPDVDAAASLALGDGRPDMHVILDVPYEQAFARVGIRGGNTASDRFEREDRSFHDKVRNGFLEIARDLGERAILLDASGTVEETYSQLEKPIGELIRNGVPI